MAHIDRPGKTGGTTRYTTEVTAGFDLIRETEVDGDLDTIYGEFNGGIDDTNIRAGASIDYSKLDLTHRITVDDLVPGFILPTSAIPPGGFPAGSYAPLSIDTPSLAIDATTQWAAQIGTPLTLPYNILDTAELTVSSITSPASRGGLIFIVGMFSGWWAAPAPEASFWARLRVAGTQVAISQIAAGATGASMQVPFQISCISLPRGAAGSTGPIILTAQLSIAGGPLIGTLAQIRDAQLIAIELA
jgi:hypothetical protein